MLAVIVGVVIAAEGAGSVLDAVGAPVGWATAVGLVALFVTGQVRNPREVAAAEKRADDAEAERDQANLNAAEWQKAFEGIVAANRQIESESTHGTQSDALVLKLVEALQQARKGSD